MPELPRHLIAQEYDGLNPIDARGSWSLIGIHAAQRPDFMGSELNGLSPYADFSDGMFLVDVHSIHLIGDNRNYTGIAPTTLQPNVREVRPYEVA